MRVVCSFLLCVCLLSCLSVVFSQEDIAYTGTIAWSPTNELLVSAPSGLYLYSAGTIQTLSTYPTNHPAFSPDGTLLAYAVVSDETPSVVVQHTHENLLLFTFAVDADLVSAIAFNADSSLLAVTVNRFIPNDFRNMNSTEVWDIETQHRLKVLDFGIPNGGALTWGDSTDTVWMLGGDYDGVFSYINAINAVTGEQVVSIQEYLMFFTPGTNTMNNQWAVFWTAVDAPEIPSFIIYRLDTTAIEPQPYRIIEFDQPFFGLSINEIGTQLAFGTDRDAGIFGIFDVEQEQIIHVGQTEESIRKLLFSPDGSLLAITTHSQARYTQDVEIWDTQTMLLIDTISVSSSVVEQPPISCGVNITTNESTPDACLESLQLVNENTGQILSTITENTTITLEPNLTIRANTVPATVGSVVFSDGTNTTPSQITLPPMNFPFQAQGVICSQPRHTAKQMAVAQQAHRSRSTSQWWKIELKLLFDIISIGQPPHLTG